MAPGGWARGMRVRPPGGWVDGSGAGSAERLGERRGEQVGHHLQAAGHRGVGPGDVGLAGGRLPWGAVVDGGNETAGVDLTQALERVEQTGAGDIPVGTRLLEDGRMPAVPLGPRMKTLTELLEALTI